MPSVQFNPEDNKVVSDFLGLLVNLGMTPTQACETVDEVLLKVGYNFVYFNGIEDFWIVDHEDK